MRAALDPGIAGLINFAPRAACTCRDRKAGSLIKAAQNGCLKCSSEFIRQAGKQVRGTTALIEAAKDDHTCIVQLLLPFEGRLKDAEGKSVIYHAAANGKTMLDTVLKTLEPELLGLIQDMRRMQCVCSIRSNNIKEAVENQCMRCSALQIYQASNHIDTVFSEVKAVTDHRIVPIKLMSALQAKLDTVIRVTELMFALRNNLYVASVVLVDGQRDIRDSRGRKASGYAVSVHNPKLWALFPQEISQEYVADLKAAYSAECVCDGRSKSLFVAVELNCTRCCTHFILNRRAGTPNSTELMNAVRNSDVRIVRLLMHVQAGIQDKYGRSALMFAITFGNLQVIKVLAQKEAGLKDGAGRTALIYTLLCGRLEAAKLLLPFERDISDNKGRTAEFYAFYADNPEMWRLFRPDITVNEGTKMHNEMMSKCICGEPAKNLVEAATNNCLQCCIKFQRQAGQVVNEKTALMGAVMWDNPDILKLLMSKEARMQGIQDYTALLFAALFGQLNAVKLLMPLEKVFNNHKQRSVCTLVARSKHEQVLTYVLREMWPGAYEYLQNVRNSRCVCGGRSYCLGDAAESGCSKCAALFIHEVGDHDCDPAMMLAARQGHINIVKLLIPFEIGMRGKNGTTSLMEAAGNGHAEIVKLLLPHEAGITTNRGDTALIQAVGYHQRQCFEILRCDPKELGASKIPAYLFALYDGDLEAALQHQKEWNSVFKQGLTVLDFALLRGGSRFIRALTRDPHASQQLANSNTWSEGYDNSMITNLLSDPENQNNFRHILNVICSAKSEARMDLLCIALFQWPGPAFRLLRPFCTPTESAIENQIHSSRDKANITCGFKAMKNAGVFRGIYKQSFDLSNIFDEGLRYLEANPLTWKQLKLARRQVKKLTNQANRQLRDQIPNFDDSDDFYESDDYDDYDDSYGFDESSDYDEFDEDRNNLDEVPEQKQWAWREVEAESAFNRSLLLKSRDIVWDASPASKLVHDSSTNSIEHKQARVNLLLVASYQFMYRVVQEMLDE